MKIILYFYDKFFLSLIRSFYTTNTLITFFL